MISRVAGYLSRNPSLILAIAFVVAGLSTGYLWDFEKNSARLEIDPSIKNLVPNNGQDLKIYHHTQEIFENDDYLLVVWLTQDLFTTKNLRALKRFTRELESLPGVVKVDSLATAMSINSELDWTRIDPFLHSIPSNAEELSKARKNALANPIFNGQLVSGEGNGAILSVHFDQAFSNVELMVLMEEVRSLSEHNAEGLRQFLTGPLYMRMETSRLLMRDLYRVLPMAVLVTLFIAILGFRNILGPILPAFSNILALVVTLMIFVAQGNKLNFITAILPAVIYVIGFAYSIHVITEFERFFAQMKDKHQALKRALEDVFLPITLTAMTTAIGFLSLTLSDIRSIQIFGLYAALGTSLAWITSLIVVPSGLACFASHRGEIRKKEYQLSQKITRFVVNYRTSILTAGFVLFMVSIWGASRINVSTDYLENFSDDNVIHENFRLTNSTFSGAVPVQVLLRAPHEDAFKDPQFLQIVTDLQSWIEAIPSVGGVYTIVDYLDVLETAFAEELEEDPSGERSKNLNSALLLFGGGVDADRYADPSFSETILRVKTSLVATKEITRLIDLIQARVDALPLGVSGNVTGSSSLIAKTIDNIAKGQLMSLFFALLSIYVVLLLVFKSWIVALVALLPNALPLSVFFGYLGVTGTPLNITTSMVAAVVLGIAIDDSIHFLTRFKKEFSKVSSSTIAIQRTLKAIGRPVTLTTLALCAGFVMLSIGELQNQLQFGLLSAGSLFIAWLVDIIFTPALCHLLAPLIQKSE